MAGTVHATVLSLLFSDSWDREDSLYRFPLFLAVIALYYVIANLGISVLMGALGFGPSLGFGLQANFFIVGILPALWFIGLTVPGEYLRATPLYLAVGVMGGMYGVAVYLAVSRIRSKRLGFLTIALGLLVCLLVVLFGG